MNIKEKKSESLIRLYKILDKYDQYTQEEKVKVKDYLIIQIKQINDVWFLNSILDIEKRIEYCAGLLLGATIINVDYRHIDVKNILKGKAKIQNEIEKLQIVKRMHTIQMDLDNSTSEEDKTLLEGLNELENTLMVAK